MTTNNDADVKEAREKLLEVCKESIQHMGIEKGLQQLMVNQYGIEQIQSDFHCLLVTTIDMLQAKGVFTKEEFDTRYQQNSKEQQKELQRTLERMKEDSDV